MDRKIYVIDGPPCSGKDFIIRRFLKDYYIISSSSLLREEGKKNPEILETMDKGLLVDDNIINPLIIDAIKKTKKNIVLNGWPRTKSQAIFAKDNLTIHGIIRRSPDPKVLVDRNITRKEKQNRKDDEGTIFLNRYLIYLNETLEIFEILKPPTLVLEENNVENKKNEILNFLETI